MRLFGSAVLAALILAGCGGATSPNVNADSLDLSVASGTASGTFTTRDATLTFRALEQDARVDVTIELNGMTLAAMLDPSSGVATLDGYATETGGDTQLLDSDREALRAFYDALNRDLDPEQLTAATQYLRRAAGLWSRTPTTVSLRRMVMGEEGRGYTMLCSYARCPAGGSFTGNCSSYNWYSYAKHDCNQGGFSYERNQQIAQLGDHYSCSGDEWYLSGSTWVCGEPDHWLRPKVVGNCFGRCGGGCGGDTQYTLDATNHDGCVRNGHALASLYCDDQFTSASDDELFASNCY